MVLKNYSLVGAIVGASVDTEKIKSDLINLAFLMISDFRRCNSKVFHQNDVWLSPVHNWTYL